jgi:hypothetical protein
MIPKSEYRFFGRIMLHKGTSRPEGTSMHGIIYLIGLIVVIMAILSFLGLR